MMCVFLLQAEDGIRDLVRSRGLGDVYKRQDLQHFKSELFSELRAILKTEAQPIKKWLKSDEVKKILKAVSYTHLTLPTSDLV